MTFQSNETILNTRDEMSFSFSSFYYCRLGGKTPDVGSRTYANIIREQQLRAEEQEVLHYSN